VSDQAGQPKAPLLRVFKHRWDQGEQPVLIEMAVSNIDLIPVLELELTVLLGVAHIDAGRLDTSHVVITLLGIDDVEGLLASLEALLNEGKQRPVLFLTGVKKGANMPVFAKPRTCDPIGSRASAPICSGG
jgi:hypothetical protein